MNINSRTSKINFAGFASGAIASFTGLREAPIKVRAYINAIQEGSGNPAPDNIRPIIGRNSVTITANAVDHMISLGDTCYGGSLDVTTGVLTVDMGLLELKKVIWNKDPNRTNMWYGSATGVIKNPNKANRIVSNIFKTINDPNSGQTNYIGGNTSYGANVFYCKSPLFEGLSTYQEVQTVLANNNAVCAYPLATPITVLLTPTQVEQIIGTNNIFSDTGNVEVYFVTI